MHSLYIAASASALRLKVSEERYTFMPVNHPVVQMTLMKLDELVDLASRLDDESANATLPVEGSNSVVQILTHCCGVMRRWSSTVNLGVEIPRDRDAEFSANMPVAEVLELARVARAGYLADVEQSDLNAPPANPGRHSNAFWLATQGGVLVHVLEEICQHLGHAEITRDVVMSGILGD